ncbi:MAG: hypothetical protein WA001_01590 [Patescibacteria group bacterium]
MTIRRLLLLIVLGLLAGLFEATTSTLLPSPFSALRPIIPVIVGFIVLQRPESAYAFAVSAGAAMDLFTVGPSTLAFVRLLLIAFAIAVVAERVLTNHSLYAAMALTVLARILDWVWLFGVQAIVHLEGVARAFVPGWQAALTVLAFDAMIIVVAFIVNHVVFKRFVAFRLARH